MPQSPADGSGYKSNEGLKDILGIALKRKEGSPAFEPVKIVRHLVRPLPPPPKSGYQPEPGITEEDYSHILSVVRHEGRTVVFNKHNAKFSGILETVPGVFANHPSFKRSRQAQGHGEWEFDMTSREDEGRQVRIHAFVFNLFVA